MFILKHVEYKIESLQELKKLLKHIKKTTAQIKAVNFKEIYFIKKKDEFVLLMDCLKEVQYLKWRDICPPPPGATDWYEILLSKKEYFN